MYIVDGNNVMGQRVGWHRDKPAAARRLVADLSVWSRSENVPVTVVFDAKPVGDLAAGAVDGVRILFARAGSNADDRIVELAASASEPGEVLAVTSDRRLIERLERIGVRTIRSGRFRRLLESR